MDNNKQAYDIKSKEDTVYQTAQNSIKGIQVTTAQSVTGTIKSVKGQLQITMLLGQVDLKA